MSRFISVCLRAVVALVALFGTLVPSPGPVVAATGTLSVETPLHESPAPEAPWIALLPVGAVVSIDGPPVDGFYPVTAGDLSGWMRGETLALQKDIVADGGEASSLPAGSDGLVPVAQTTSSDPTPAETPATDPAAVPAQTKEFSAATEPGSTSTEPSADLTQDVAAAPPAETAALPADSAADPAPLSDPTPAEAAPADTAALESTVETIGAATPVPVATTTGTPVDAAAKAAPDPASAPSPTPGPEPVGPASVTVDAPIRTGPGPAFDLIFTVPMGSTVQQTGNVTDGYVTVQYKEVTGWLALEQLGAPSSFVPETPLAVTATPVDEAPTEASPVATEPVPDEPVKVKTPRPGSGVAFTTVDMSLRAGPSASEEPVTVVPAGSRVVLTGVMEGGFQRVTYKDEIGWIAGDYLETPADPEPDTGRHGDEQYSRRQIVRIIYEAADRYDQSRSDMLRVAECESNLDPYAVNPSGSYGLFQFIRSTWESTPYGNKNIFDPVANANAAAWMWSEGRKSEWVCQ
ncbi:MAG TPA: SH3 domain-containing protein [Thermomicrobiales bacterium]|nr:SH3 domain-containing protein [Thermomicrobiales bacterium]